LAVCGLESIHTVKVLVHLQKIILSSFTHPDVIPNS